MESAEIARRFLEYFSQRGHTVVPSASLVAEVGKTSRHATFFQMLGNFSFGDYFKSQAIPLAWELLTRPESDGGFGFGEGRLWATVYTGDDEAYSIWRNAVGLPPERIQRRGLA